MSSPVLGVADRLAEDQVAGLASVDAAIVAQAAKEDTD
jgi:hypothetical protein